MRRGLSLKERRRYWREHKRAQRAMPEKGFMRCSFCRRQHAGWPLHRHTTLDGARRLLCSRCHIGLHGRDKRGRFARRAA